jgi:hypothetical protein
MIGNTKSEKNTKKLTIKGGKMKKNQSAILKKCLFTIAAMASLAFVQPVLADHHSHHKQDHVYHYDHESHHRPWLIISEIKTPSTWEGWKGLINSRIPREGSWAVSENPGGVGRLLYITDLRQDGEKIRIRLRNFDNGDGKIKAKGRHLWEIERDLGIVGYYDPRKTI